MHSLDRINKQKIMLRSNHQSGFSHIVLPLVIVLLVAVVGYAGYRAVSMNSAPASSLASTSSTTTSTTNGLQAATFAGQSAADGQPDPTPSTSTSVTYYPTWGTITPTSTGTIPVSGSSSSGSTSGSTTTGDNGVSGNVTITLVCKAPRMCPDLLKPYSAEVVVSTQGGSKVTSFTSATNGTFNVMLNPGTYVLVPQSYDSGRITAPKKTVTVTSGKFTTVSILYTDNVQ